MKAPGRGTAIGNVSRGLVFDYVRGLAHAKIPKDINSNGRTDIISIRSAGHFVPSSPRRRSTRSHSGCEIERTRYDAPSKDPTGTLYAHVGSKSDTRYLRFVRLDSVLSFSPTWDFPLRRSRSTSKRRGPLRRMFPGSKLNPPATSGRPLLQKKIRARHNRITRISACLPVLGALS